MASQPTITSGETVSAKQKIFAILDNYRGVVALVLVFILGCLYSPKAYDTHLPVFMSWRTQLDTIDGYSEYGILAVGMTLVILSGGIDLSVSSVLGLCATMFALLTIGKGWGIAAAVIAVMGVGCLAGSINGVLVSRFRLQPFVATLAMMTAARGMAKYVSGGIKVQPGAQPWYALQDRTPEFWNWFTKQLPGIGLRPYTVLFLVCIGVMAVVVRYTTFGRKLYSIGGNEEAARLAGISVWKVKLATYALCGIFAALAGVVNACRLDQGDPEAGFGFELDAIAAVVIGGTSLTGGRGGMGLTLVGVLVTAYINKILSLNSVAIDQRMMVQGAIIVLAVLIQQRRKGRT